MEAVNAVPVVGEPLAYGIGFVMLLFVALTDSWARSLVTVAHEGGHMAVAVVTGRGYSGFTLADGGGGATYGIKGGWGVGDWLVTLAGYPLPPLLGLGGATLIVDGNAWAVLLIGLVLLLAAVFQAANWLAILVTVLVLLVVGWAAFAGGPTLQAAVAVGLTWWMLIGGAYWSSSGLWGGGTGDAAHMAEQTWIPRILWDLAFAFVGLVCLWAGARRLLEL